ncbi:hypothetical protein CRUP_035923 [Coryphaenoides rupestris]|nr:hypothetical protein CRUP_035923 [Coryphaenoides rupestris]
MRRRRRRRVVVVVMMMMMMMIGATTSRVCNPTLTLTPETQEEGQENQVHTSTTRGQLVTLQRRDANPGLSWLLGAVGGLEIAQNTEDVDGCEEDVDECEQEVCENGGVCINTLGGFSCNCSLGFTGRLCQEVSDEDATQVASP